MKGEKEKIACLTVYDASFAELLDTAGVEVLLVGDSLGMVLQGRDTTLPVTLDEMIYHSASVRRGRRRALIMVDMPFMSFGTSLQAMENAGRLMKEGGAHMVKIEGGSHFTGTVRELAAQGIPVCCHLGLLPQSVHKLGGYRVQGRDDLSAQSIVDDALALQAAGADMMLLECVPADLGATISQSLDIPVIGIGAGPECDAQVLVLYDILGITRGKRPRFSRDFLSGRDGIEAAIEEYVRAVKNGDFPAAEHCF